MNNIHFSVAMYLIQTNDFVTFFAFVHNGSTCAVNAGETQYVAIIDQAHVTWTRTMAATFSNIPIEILNEICCFVRDLPRENRDLRLLRESDILPEAIFALSLVDKRTRNSVFPLLFDRIILAYGIWLSNERAANWIREMNQCAHLSQTVK